jgi:hypothetical protein
MGDCYFVELGANSHNLTNIYECIDALFNYICEKHVEKTTIKCTTTKTKSWIIIGTSNCLIKVTTPHPVQKIEGTGFFPSMFSSSIRIICDSPFSVAETSDIILKVLGSCSNIGVTLTR